MMHNPGLYFSNILFIIMFCLLILKYSYDSWIWNNTYWTILQKKPLFYFWHSVFIKLKFCCKKEFSPLTLWIIVSWLAILFYLYKNKIMSMLLFTLSQIVHWESLQIACLLHTSIIFEHFLLQLPQDAHCDAFYTDQISFLLHVQHDLNTFLVTCLHSCRFCFLFCDF